MSELSISKTKPCRKCGEVLPVTAEYFHRDKRTALFKGDGFTTVCKKCRKDYADHCDFCGKHFRTSLRVRRYKYCSDECKSLARLGGIGAVHGRLIVVKYAGVGTNQKSQVLCQCVCGNERFVDVGNLFFGSVQSCGCLREEYYAKGRLGGENSARWKGGRIVDKRGYIRLHKPGHPNAMSDDYVQEHVYVMSHFLGRPLRKGENVHHKNGLKHDNRLENLELWIKGQPAGQRIEDLVEHARYILRTYEADAQKLQRRALLGGSQPELPLQDEGTT